MKPIGDQGDRTKPETSNNLRNHHHCADHNHRPYLALVPPMRFSQEDVRMTKVFN
jgi:hypothetical protein